MPHLVIKDAFKIIYIRKELTVYNCIIKYTCICTVDN